MSANAVFPEPLTPMIATSPGFNSMVLVAAHGAFSTSRVWKEFLQGSWRVCQGSPIGAWDSLSCSILLMAGPEQVRAGYGSRPGT
jgi:hypothetical protein